MKKMLRSVSLSLALCAALGATLMLACGPDKPPLTPDVADPLMEGVDSGAPAPPASGTPAPAPAK